MKRAFLLRLGFGLILMPLLPSCGSDFRAAWKKAPVTNGVEGKWQGTWLSEENGHHGSLRCVVHPVLKEYPVGQKPPAVRPFGFHYHATWKSILSGSYKAMHNVQKKKDGTYTFKGDHKMPDWAGGLYHYEGTIKGDNFNACYESGMDRGTFTMKRVR
ncbi:MAG TPA: hypothetical protein PLB55_25600 [Prosthecobacter sp.]|nr:hypothetical protein [Prosthecobacter sp.]